MKAISASENRVVSEKNKQLAHTFFILRYIGLDQKISDIVLTYVSFPMTPSMASLSHLTLTASVARSKSYLVVYQILQKEPDIRAWFEKLPNSEKPMLLNDAVDWLEARQRSIPEQITGIISSYISILSGIVDIATGSRMGRTLQIASIDAIMDTYNESPWLLSTSLLGGTSSSISYVHLPHRE